MAWTQKIYTPVFNKLIKSKETVTSVKYRSDTRVKYSFYDLPILFNKSLVYENTITSLGIIK